MRQLSALLLALEQYAQANFTFPEGVRDVLPEEPEDAASLLRQVNPEANKGALGRFLLHLEHQAANFGDNWATLTLTAMGQGVRPEALRATGP